MSVRIVPAPEPPNPVERPLWRLVKAQRTAVALIHEWPHGWELRIEVDGQLRWARLFRRDHDGLLREADKRRALREWG